MLEQEMEFDIIKWCLDNFDDQEREEIKDMSRQIAMNKYWETNLPISEFKLESDGSSEPFDEWDFSNEYVA
jgi:hypothetical protein